MNFQTGADIFLPTNSVLLPSGQSPTAQRHAAMLAGAALAYATVRYHLFKGVPWADWPTYTANKALALTAVALIVSGLVSFARRRPKYGGAKLRLASWAISAHAALSAVLLGPAYFPKFYIDTKLTATAGFALLLGALAATVFLHAGRSAGQWSERSRWTITGALAFAGGAHAALPGWQSWLTPDQWPGFLPPITLIAFVTGLAGLALALAHANLPARNQPK